VLTFIAWPLGVCIGPLASFDVDVGADGA
jgi:hypothetical protein